MPRGQQQQQIFSQSSSHPYRLQSQSSFVERLKNLVGRFIGWEDRGGEIEQVNEVMIPIGNFGPSESRSPSENEIDWSAMTGLNQSNAVNDHADQSADQSNIRSSEQSADQSNLQTNLLSNSHPVSMQMDQLELSSQIEPSSQRPNSNAHQSTPLPDLPSISPSDSTHSSQLASRAAIYGAISKILSQNLAQSKSLSRTQFDTIHRLFLNCCPSAMGTLEEVPVDAAVFDLCKIPFVSKAIRKAQHGSGTGRKEAERALRRILAKELCKSLQQQSKEPEKESKFDLANYKQAPGRSTYSAKFLDYERELKTIEEFKRELATAPIKIPDFALGKQSVIFQAVGRLEEKASSGGVAGSGEKLAESKESTGFVFESKPVESELGRESTNQPKRFSFEPKTADSELKQEGLSEAKRFSFDSKPAEGFTFDSKPAEGFSFNSKPAEGFSFDSKPSTGQSSAFSFQSQPAAAASRPAQNSFSFDSKPTQNAFESKPTQAAFSFDSKPTQATFSFDSKTAPSPFSFESKPAQTTFSFDSKPAQPSFSTQPTQLAQATESSDSRPTEPTNLQPSTNAKPAEFPFNSKPQESPFSFSTKPADQNQFSSAPAPEPKTIPADTKSAFSFQQQSPAFSFQNPQSSSATVAESTEKKSPFQAQNFDFSSQQQFPKQPAFPQPNNAFQAQPAFTFTASQSAFQTPSAFSFNQQPASEQQRPQLAFSFPSPAPTQQPNPFGANAGTFNLFQAPSAAPQPLFNPPAKLDFSQQPVFSFTSNSSVTSPKSAGGNSSAFPTSFVNRRRK